MVEEAIKMTCFCLGKVQCALQLLIYRRWGLCRCTQSFLPLSVGPSSSSMRSNGLKTCVEALVGSSVWRDSTSLHFITKRSLYTKENEHSGQQVSVRKKAVPPSSVTQKVKQAGRDFTYLIVVLVGVGVTGGLLYVVFSELFSSSSPSKIYGTALQKCRAHPEVIGFFGEPIKGYGETTRRGRRQHVSHIEYMKDGIKHMRLKFYIEGSEPRAQGTVHVEVKENPDSGKFEFRYIFIDVDSYPPRAIIVEDNRITK
ncbi:mitochondrial import inner membrane translocase subunit Tim21 [Protopterus annectens]|uniref:mitochondrial import inner membrane translocase subunit Tim21 n=1 Tax=Protopterus annectens TaxID=7888 RepID=UPI001CFB23C0|nr:mitochondrial import inner membrane translocase subunit Tim21 [Protopterus annectens]